ncbi:ABC transporter ATP-binding protein [Glaciibacter psychrotolerans]|uniref:Branched-chain amino acid transport system ATP-binding protein n=1 Tax=Glaciibacter psychrotolerans TaxID=670054 RepID=A0A7Z0EGC6_9MICO|nr:ATP-binding cassette domain-containing protein [Leifsonia psychrotolerans]NYJ20444.1 branched-chain amino acid transport system ATP-binding protein [Leifsonia psychrotolerans]
MQNDALLEATGISKSYGGIQALQDVSIRVGAGEILGLVGPNGAGKTTLVDMITGHQIMDRGTLKLRGEPLSGLPAVRARRGLGRTFQHPQLALELTVEENLLVGAAAYRFKSAWRMALGVITDGIMHRKQELDAVREVARELGVPDLNELTANLSLGEQRLTEVARALVQNPTVMLLDEPFAGADAHSIEGIVEAIQKVRARGHGVVLVDHNVDLLTSLADRVVLLAQGKVVFEGTPAQCLASEEMQQVYFGVGGEA